jgi:DNA-binding NarL/FixJ family response regulator
VLTGFDDSNLARRARAAGAAAFVSKAQPTERLIQTISTLALCTT